MAFDIVYRDDQFLIVEMSYIYVDNAIHGTPGHYTLSEAGELAFHAGQIWPQELFVRHVRDCMQRDSVGTPRQPVHG